MEQDKTQQLPGPGRLEAFSDGVLAIVITLLVLELRVPHIEATQNAHEAFQALILLGPKFLGYILSFLFIAVFWINHHRFFQLVGRVDTGLLWWNIFLLLAVSFIPFPTAFVGEYPWNGTALMLFSLVLMAAGIAFQFMWRHAQAQSLLHPQVEKAVIDRALLRGRIGPMLYALAAMLAFILPIGSWLLFVGIAVYYALPSKLFRQEERA